MATAFVVAVAAVLVVAAAFVDLGLLVPAAAFVAVAVLIWVTRSG